MTFESIINEAKNRLEASFWGNKGKQNLITIDRDRLDCVLKDLARRAEQQGYDRCKGNHKKKVLT
jgi:hypothetical protein